MARNSKKTSILDEFQGIIAEMLDSGCTYEQIADEIAIYLDEDAPEISKDNIYFYATQRGLRSKVTQGARNGRVVVPKCKECDKAIRYLNYRGIPQILCGEKMQQIYSAINNSPMWCPEREVDIDKLFELYGIRKRRNYE